MWPWVFKNLKGTQNKGNVEAACMIVHVFFVIEFQKQQLQSDEKNDEKDEPKQFYENKKREEKGNKRHHMDNVEHYPVQRIADVLLWEYLFWYPEEQEI
jgi:hypothetical protein